MRPGMITPGKLLITPSGHIGRCPPYVYRFAGVDGYCPCYVDPDPPTWDSQTVYQWLDCVRHNGQVWYSGRGLNQGNEPGTFESGWASYIHCNNELWDSIPPFGGVDKTPAMYGLSIDVSGVKSYTSYGGTPWHSSTARFRAYFRLPNRGGCQWVFDAEPGERVECQFSFAAEGEDSFGPWHQDGVLGPDDLNLWVNLYFGGCPDGGFSQISIQCWTRRELCAVGGGDIRCNSLPFQYSDGLRIYPVPIRDLDLPACAMQETINWSADWSTPSDTHTASGRLSWRPLDCEYSLWDANTIYSSGDCVAWDGRFYRSCAANNQGHPPEPDASNVCEAGYWWRLA